MIDLLEQSSAWLEDQRHTFRTRDVTYRRGGESMVLRATIGRTQFTREDPHGVVLETEMRDYLFRSEDLVLASAATVPERGDRIEDQGFTYEVLPLGSEPPWRYSDPYRNTIRVHTKQIDQEEAS